MKDSSPKRTDADGDAVAAKDAADRRIARVFADVQPADDLKDRVLGRLANGHVSLAGARRKRRRVWFTVGAAAVALAVTAALGLSILSDRRLSPSLVEAEAIRYFKVLAAEPVDFRRRIARDFPANFSSNFCIGTHQVQFGPRGVVVNAYDLQRNGRRALVIVLPRQIVSDDLASSAGSRNGLTVKFVRSASGEYVYVIVCKEERDLRLFHHTRSIT